MPSSSSSDNDKEGQAHLLRARDALLEGLRAGQRAGVVGVGLRKDGKGARLVLMVGPKFSGSISEFMGLPVVIERLDDEPRGYALGRGVTWPN